ncbi:MAG: 3-methyladenine DNA glycosylase, partial [Thaumarchaeota archaeon]
GIEVMKRNRGVDSLELLTNGPGKLTKALAITNTLNGVDVTAENSELIVVKDRWEKFEVETSHRIGVKNDLPQELRFYIKNNKFVSK